MHSSTLFTAVILLSAALIKAYDPVKMLCLVNSERSRSGLSPLGLSNQLQNSAQEHSEDQAQMRSMTHDGSDGSSPGERVERAGYKWNAVAENVAYGYGDEEECMKEWMNSPGHRENILGPDYTHFGSAVGYSGSTPYYTQDFGGDGQRHNFPECPSGGSYGDDGGSDNYNGGSDYNGGSAPSKNYNGGGGSDNYNGGSDYNGGGSDYNGGGGGAKDYNGSRGGSDNYNGGSSPSKNYSGGSAPSSGHRHKSGRKPSSSYGGNDADSSDDEYGNQGHKPASRKKKTYSKKPVKSSYGSGGKLPSHNTKPKPKPKSSYGGSKPTKSTKTRGKSYGKSRNTRSGHDNGKHYGSQRGGSYGNKGGRKSAY